MRAPGCPSRERRLLSCQAFHEVERYVHPAGAGNAGFGGRARRRRGDTGGPARSDDDCAADPDHRESGRAFADDREPPRDDRLRSVKACVATTRHLDA